MKKVYFGSNLKMYKNIEDTVKYLRELTELTADISREEIELFIIPSYTTLDRATTSVDRNLVRLGAQNMCWEEQGQFTGEISPLMLQEMGLDLVMIGHSERRHVFGETDEEENRKVKCGLEHGFTPRHIGHGSQDEYISQPLRSNVFSFLQALRIALTSACAVGSLLAVTRFTPVATTLPSFTITAPNGPPPFLTLLSAREIASRIISSFLISSFSL